MALACVLLPYYTGAALVSLAFPLYVLLACDSDVDAAHNRAASGKPPQQQGCVGLGRLPVFKIALWPTQYALQRLLGKQHWLGSHHE